ncbi:MAG TPA: PD-(D/E)XK nuclease family protein [Longimicrobiales bacterium]|nr:PD-(D/E)XK nuclease family protein [Longimicrobiales bacterium]
MQPTAVTQASATRLPQLLRALATEAESYRFQRKLLVCPRAGVGRELLRALSAAGVPWINFEVVTPLQLAHHIVAADLARQGLGVADEFDELGHFDAAIDAVLGTSSGRLAELSRGVGLRQAIGKSIRDLRMAGIDAAALEATRLRDEEKRSSIAGIMRDYESRLAAAGLVDGPAVLERAAAILSGPPRAGHGDGGLTLTPDGRVLLAPGLTARGRAGELVQALLDSGAVALPADPVHGLEVPAGRLPAPADEAGTPLAWLHHTAGWPGTDADQDGGGVILGVFAASSVAAELREVLRRVMAAGLRWDEVEIVATDPMAYGVALDGLARRMSIPVSYSAGLPLARTRPGRAAAAFLRWLEHGLPAAHMRQMLERGDVAHPSVSGTALARRLRALKVGRGRDRYGQRVAARMRALELPQDPGDTRTPEEFAADRDRERAELDALSAVLQPLLDAAPADGKRVSAGELADGVETLLRMVPLADASDRTARQRMQQRLMRMSSTVRRPTTLSSAAAILMSRLEDHVPSPAADGGSPWVAAGGHLHLSDLDQGGHACRRATFIVGLDAGRFPGHGGTDALLVDEDRRRLAGDGPVPRLPTSAERLAERRYAFAALAARLRGTVTFSYATWDAAEARSVAPASELLQAYRLMSGDVNADYESLHRAVAPAASAVPRGSTLLDGADTWLHALSAPDTDAPDWRMLRHGVAAVCQAFPPLGVGVQAVKARRRPGPAGPWHGAIAARPELDPRAGPEPAPVSATALQTLGACPHRYLLRYVLRLRQPDEPPAPDQWLRPGERGSLLHAVFEEALRTAAGDGVAYDDDAFLDLALRILLRLIDELSETSPPPGHAVRDRELEELRADVRAFVAMVREDAPRPIALELVFGRDGAAPVEIPLPDGSHLLLAGAIDRVDELDDGTVVVVDYKTGSAGPFQRRSGPFDGGRRLQHVLYAAAAARILDRSVERAEFHFPSRRSQNHRVRHDVRRLDGGLDIVADLLSLVREGRFVPTNVADDCRFCDFATICRASVDGRDNVVSPLADWARQADDEAVDVLRRIRR